MVGSDAAEELNKSIEYENSPKFTVYTAMEYLESSNIIFASTKEGVRVIDTLSLEFKTAEGYTFLRWQAVQKSKKNVVLDEYVQFKDSKATSTTVTIQKQQSAILAGDLLIRPIAVKTCTIQTAFPAYEDAGVACDNSIRLTFSQNLSTANYLSKISITIEGHTEAWTEHFSAPAFFEGKQNVIAINADISRRIVVAPSATQKVTVRIPGTFTFDTILWDAPSYETRESAIITNKDESKEITGLNPGSRYSFKAVPYYNDLTGGNDENAASTRLAPVTSHSITKITSTSINVDWTEPLGKYDNILVYLKKSNDTAYTLVATLDIGTKTFTYIGLTAGTEYEIKITSKVTNDSDVQEEEATVLKQYTKPTTIATNITTTNNTINSVTLSWTKPTGSEFNSII